MHTATPSRNEEPLWEPGRPTLLQVNGALSQSIRGLIAINFVAIKVGFQVIFEEFSRNFHESDKRKG